MSKGAPFLHAKNKYNLILSTKSDFSTFFLDAKNKYNLILSAKSDFLTFFLEMTKINIISWHLENGPLSIEEWTIPD